MRKSVVGLLLLAVVGVSGFVRTSITHSTVSVGSSVTSLGTQVLSTNTRRNFLEIWNIGGAGVWCAFGTSSLTPFTGFFIPSSASSVFYSAKFYDGVPSQTVTCVGASSTTQLSIGEGNQP